jgi:hypothetical protein
VPGDFPICGSQCHPPAPCAATGACPHPHRSLGPPALQDVGEDLLGQVASGERPRSSPGAAAWIRADIEVRNELDVRVLAHEAIGEPAGDPDDLERVRHAVLKRRAGRRAGDLCDPPYTAAGPRMAIAPNGRNCHRHP